MSELKREFTFFTAEGVTFTEEGTTLANALRRARPLIGENNVVAAVETDSVVAPAPGKLTALIVRSSGGGAQI
jgi:hypothetical protein